MSTDKAMVTEALTRPIIGIENRTAQETFDIMCDRIRRSAALSEAEQQPVALYQLELEDGTIDHSAGIFGTVLEINGVKVVKSTALYAHPPAKREAGEAPPPQSHLMGGTAEQERLRFEGDLDKWMKIIGAGITGYQPEAYALMDLACEELVRLRNAFASLDWYWPEEDTSSDACADGPWQIAENCDVKPGEVFAYSRGGVVETRYYGFLEATEDAESDDQFEADEPTREAAEAKISAELQRRAGLATTEGQP